MDLSICEKTGDQSQFCWQNVLFNPTILDCLIEHMVLEDIKRLRSTCKQLNELITSRKRFTENTVFLVCESINRSSEATLPVYRTLEILQNTNVKWKNFKIILYNDFFKVPYKKEKEQLIELIKNNVEHLTIIGTKRFMRTVSCVLFLMEEWQIPNCENITRLSMEFNLLNSLLITGFSFLTDNIKQIDILESKLKSEKVVEYDVFTANLEIIAQKCKRLEKFTIKNGYAPLMNKVEVKKQLLNILRANAETLTSIEWLCDPIVNSQEFETLTMPKLKELQAYCSKESLTMNNFARNQSGLEKLSVVFFHKIPSQPIDQFLQTMLKFKKTLKTFVVTFCSLESANWQCLEQMEVLRTLFIFGMQDEGGIQRFTNFPKSLKSLIFRELTLQENFYSALWLSNFPFESISKLSLMECKPSLTDGDILEISTRMTNLTVLQISGAPKITDLSITGTASVPNGFGLSNVGVPLNNLKKLRELTLNLCSQITHKIQGVLSFEHLRKLELVDNDSLKLTEDLLAMLIFQNSRMEKVYFSQRSLPKYKRGGFLPLQIFVTKKSGGRCRLIENTDEEEPDEFEIDNEDESEMTDGDLPLTAEEDEYEDENEWVDEEEDDESDSDF